MWVLILHVAYYALIIIIGSVTVRMVIKMFILRKIKIKAAETWLTKVVEELNKLPSHVRANTKSPVYPVNIENAYHISFFTEMLTLFNKGKFYLEVMEYLHDQGILTPDQQDHKKYWFDCYANSNLFTHSESDIQK